MIFAEGTDTESDHHTASLLDPLMTDRMILFIFGLEQTAPMYYKESSGRVIHLTRPFQECLLPVEKVNIRFLFRPENLKVAFVKVALM